MNKSKKIKTDAIESKLSVDSNTDDQQHDSNITAAVVLLSEKIHDIAVGFAEWCATNYVPTIASKELKYWQKGTYQNKEHFYTTQELLKEFFRTKL